MQTFLTVCNGQDPSGVLRLRRGLEVHCHQPFQLVCLNDIYPRRERDGVLWEPLIEGWPAHYGKVEMWRPDLEKHGQIVFLDTTTRIIADVSPLTDYRGYFCVVSDFYWGTPCQSVASFSPGAGRPYYDEFKKNPKLYMDMGDMSAAPDFYDQTLLNLIPGPPIDYWPDGVVSSYKLTGPSGCVVKFHGKPKPEDTDWARATDQTNSMLPPRPPPREPDPMRQVLMQEQWAVPQIEPDKNNRGRTAILVAGDGVNWESVKKEEGVLVTLNEHTATAAEHGLTPDIGIFIDREPTPAKAQWVAASSPVPDGAKAFYCAVSSETHCHVRQRRYARARDVKEESYIVAQAQGNEYTHPIISALSILHIAKFRTFAIHGLKCDGDLEVTLLGETFRCSEEQYAMAREFSVLIRRFPNTTLSVCNHGMIFSWLSMAVRTGALTK